MLNKTERQKFNPLLAVTSIHSIYVAFEIISSLGIQLACPKLNQKGDIFNKLRKHSAVKRQHQLTL